MYKEIEVDRIEPNPFQTRKSHDDKIIEGIMLTSIKDSLGIRNAPLIRPHPTKEGYYQIASGHGRIKAVRLTGRKTITCRIEELTDAQMKKEVLVENVNRSDLSEEERFVALEQYVEELGFKDIPMKDRPHGWLSKLERETGLHEATLRQIYDVEELKNTIRTRTISFDLSKVSSTLIRETKGLETEDRIRLIQKAATKDWSSTTVQKIKTAIKNLKPEITKLILDEDTKLPIEAILKIQDIQDEELQKKTIQKIVQHGWGEDRALHLIKRVKSDPTYFDIYDIHDFTIDRNINESIEFVEDEIVFEGCRIEFRDAIEALDDIEDESIDCIITDPPYGVDFKTQRYRNANFGIQRNDSDTSVTVDMLKKIGRIMKQDSHAYIFTRWDIYPLLVRYIPKDLTLSNLLVWDKDEGGHGMGDLGYWAPQYELIMFLTKGRREINGKRTPNLLTFQDIRFTGEKKYHPTQKPIDLIKILVVKSTDEEETVLDPFLGSGTTALASLVLNRNIVGFEIDKTFAPSILERIKEKLAQ